MEFEMMNDWRAEEERQSERWVMENLTPEQIDRYLEEIITVRSWLAGVPGHDPSSNYIFSDICVRHENALERSNPWVG